MTSYSLKTIANLIDAQIFSGNEQFEITAIASDEGNESEIQYIRDEEFIKKHKNFLAKTCLIPSNLADKALNFENILVSEDVELSFSLLTSLFKNEINDSNFVSCDYKFVNNPTFGSGSCISSKASFGKNVSIGCNCVIGDNVSIGDNTIIESNAVIYNSCIIGKNNFISSGVIIGSSGFGFIFRDNSWKNIHHLGNVIIGDNVSIGANTCIDKATLGSTVIESNVIIDNLVHIAHNVKIGSGTAIAAKVGIAGSTIIGKKCLIGGMVGIFGHLSIADNVVISPKSNVYRDIKKQGRYSSMFPLFEHSIWKKISILISKIDKINSLLKK